MGLNNKYVTRIDLWIWWPEFKTFLSFFVFQYEVEVFQRIEVLLGYKLEVYPTEKEEALVLEERIAEAERFARLVSMRLVLSSCILKNLITNLSIVKPTQPRLFTVSLERSF